MLARAFDKAVRRKPLGFAADASLWELNVGRERDAAQVGAGKLVCVGASRPRHLSKKLVFEGNHAAVPKRD